MEEVWQKLKGKRPGNRRGDLPNCLNGRAAAEVHSQIDIGVLASMVAEQLKGIFIKQDT